MRRTVSPTTTMSTGTAAPMSHDSEGAWVTAMTTPPTASSGAVTSMVQLMSTSIWICCTSLVARVIREPAPKEETSRSEKPPTRRKMRARRSRPMPSAERAASQVAATVQIPWSTDTPSMRPPVRQM